MSLVVESTSNGTATSANSIVITAPTGIETGDLLLIIGTVNTATFTCTGFTEADTWTYDGPSGSNPAVTMLYKIAVLADESAVNYTVSGSASNLGIATMLRISGWTSGNPIWASADGGFNPTTSGTHTVSGLDLNRVSSQLLIMVGESYDDGDSDYIGNFTNYTVTSGVSNPSWTEVIDTNVVVGGGGVGRTSLGVAYANTSTASNITAFSYDYTEFDADDQAGAIGILIIIEETLSPTVDASHISITPEVFAPTVTQVNTAPDVSHNAVVPTINGLDARATAPTQWTNESQTSTTWINDTI